RTLNRERDLPAVRRQHREAGGLLREVVEDPGYRRRAVDDGVSLAAEVDSTGKVGGDAGERRRACSQECCVAASGREGPGGDPGALAVACGKDYQPCSVRGPDRGVELAEAAVRRASRQAANSSRPPIRDIEIRAGAARQIGKRSTIGRPSRVMLGPARARECRGEHSSRGRGAATRSYPGPPDAPPLSLPPSA